MQTMTPDNNDKYLVSLMALNCGNQHPQQYFSSVL